MRSCCTERQRHCSVEWIFSVDALARDINAASSRELPEPIRVTTLSQLFSKPCYNRLKYLIAAWRRRRAGRSS
jgi:hypothetical protein